MTENTLFTVKIPDGCKVPKSEENSPHGQTKAYIAASLYGTEYGKTGSFVTV